MADTTRHEWDTYVQLARQYLDRGTIENDEIKFKQEIANDLSEARKAVLEGNDDWLDKLKHALRDRGGRPVHWIQIQDFFGWCSRDQSVVLSALRKIWVDGDVPAAKRIRDFAADMPQSEISGTGTRARFISALLMGVDVEQYPPFAITVFTKAYNRTQYGLNPTDADEADVYEHALGFLDRFISEASRHGITLRHRLDAQSVVWQIQDPKDDVESSNGPEIVDPPTQKSLSQLAEELFLTEPDGFLDDIVSMLKDKKQVIFQGPPGTGKTYVAQKLAEHLAGTSDRVTLVQFHPSYAYEDFVRGYRPTIHNGQAQFELKDGPLLRAADQARQDPNSKHCLVIDEINRGNLAKIFGELYYLLEYRNEAISLQYQTEDEIDFSLPPNLYIIGTMNTADRSIALVDLALRRRFYFFDFHPDKEPVKGVLRRWLKAKSTPEMQWVADVVVRTNELLKHDRHAAIGPSYFMKEKLDAKSVCQIWKHSVLPYIEERLFGGDEVATKFDLETLKGGVQKPKDDPNDNGEAQHEEGNTSDAPD